MAIGSEILQNLTGVEVTQRNEPQRPEVSGATKYKILYGCFRCARRGSLRPLHYFMHKAKFG